MQLGNNKVNGKPTNGFHKLRSNVLQSKINYINPPNGSNLARELINSLRDKFPARNLIVDGCNGGSRAYSGAQIWKTTCKIANGLIESNKIRLQVGAPILLMCDHSYRELLIMFGAICAGASIMGTDKSGYTDLRIYCEPTKPKLIVTTLEQFPNAKRLRAEVDGMAGANIILIDEGAEKSCQGSLTNEEREFISFADDLMNWTTHSGENLIERRVNEEIEPKKHCSMLMVTSGSTGRSKVVPWTHEKQINDIWSIISANKGSVHKGQKPLLPLDENVVLAGDLPIDQGAGVVALLWCLIIGGQYVLIDAYDEVSFWHSVQKFKLSGSIASATFTYRLLKQLKNWLNEAQALGNNGKSRQAIVDISSMKFIACTGSRTNSEKILKELHLVYPELDVTQFFGATELGFISMLSTEDAPTYPHSVGHLFPGVKAKVVDVDTGYELGPEQEGEMCVWSPTLFEQYLPHPDEKLEDLMRDRFDNQGFYRTGDLVHYDSDERFYIHSRMKETLYLDQDWKTPPYEIESIIDKHPLVESSVVVGVPNLEVEGCVHPKAFIKLKSLQDLDLSTVKEPKHIQMLVDKLKLGQLKPIEDDIYQFTAKELTHPKHLHGGIRFLDHWPRIGPANKIDKQKLKLMD